jgi:hypothetical protein
MPESISYCQKCNKDINHNGTQCKHGFKHSWPRPEGYKAGKAGK